MGNSVKKLILFGFLTLVLAVSMPSVSAEWNETFEDGLIRYYSFDEDGREEIYGLYNFSEQGSITHHDNAPDLCKSGGCYWANGVNGAGGTHLDAVDTGMPTGSSARTIAFWTKAEDITDNLDTFFTYGTPDSPYNMYSLRQSPAGQWSIMFHTADDNGLGAIASNNTYFVAIRTNATSTDLFVNGTSIKRGFVLPNTVLDASGLTLFKFSYATEWVMRGMMDEFMVYNRDLSDNEITALWNDGDGIFYNENTAPTITLNSPSDGSTGHESSVILNVSVNDTDGDSMNSTFYNENWSELTTFNESSSGDNLTYEWTGLSANTTYIWHVNTTDGQETTTAEYNFTTRILPQQPSIGYPVDALLNVNSSVNFNWSESSESDSYTFFLYNSSDLIYSVNTTSNDTTYTPALIEGNYTWEVIGNNSFGYGISSGNSSFIIDLTAPSITWDTPKSTMTYYSDNNLTLNILFSDDNLYGVNITIMNETSDAIFEDEIIGITNSTWTISNNTGILSEGIYNISVSSSDDHTDNLLPITAYYNETLRGFTFDIEDKNQVSITMISNKSVNDKNVSKLSDRYSYSFDVNTSLEEFEVEFRVTAEKPLIYRQKSSYPAHFVTGLTWIDFNIKGDTESEYEVLKVNNYTYDVKIKVKGDNIIVFESVGGVNVITESSQFTIDITNPVLNITLPTSNNTITTDTSYDINYTYTEINTDLCWWSNDSGVTNTSITCGTNITTETWPEGNTTITIWINDSVGNEVSDSISFSLDTKDPEINILFPTNTTYVDNISSINFSVIDSHIDTCWYSLDAGLTNITTSCVTNITGLVNASEGSNIWLVGANDTLGNENYSIITFSINTITPDGGGGGGGASSTPFTIINLSAETGLIEEDGEEQTIIEKILDSDLIKNVKDLVDEAKSDKTKAISLIIIVVSFVLLIVFLLYSTDKNRGKKKSYLDF